VYFFELHEGDDDVYADVILAREEEITPDDFFELVQSIRRRVKDTFEEDTLIEAIAVELEREHGFTYVSDERIHAAVNVSGDDDDNFLIATEDEFTALGLAGADFRGAVIEGIEGADEPPGAGGDRRHRLN
jgi:hypothetical protein